MTLTMLVLPEGAAAVAFPATVLTNNTSPTAPGSWSNVTVPLNNIPFVSEAAPNATANKPSQVATASASANSQVPSDL